MDISRYPLEKLVYFVAGIIPGFVALLIYNAASPRAFVWFLEANAIGYRTKVTVVLVVAFIIGNSLTRFLAALLGGIGGAIGGWKGAGEFIPAHQYAVAAWRDPRWRALLRDVLGEKAPNDTRVITEDVYNQRLQLIQFLPVADQNEAIFKLNSDRLSSEIDDGNWARWYDHYHHIALQPDERDLVLYVTRGLSFNLETTAVYLISAMNITALRHWWAIVPSVLWVSILVAEEFSSWRNYSNRWSTLSAQIRYFAEERRRGA